MSVLENLVVMHRRQCDERRRHLADLEDLAQRLRADAMRLLGAIGLGAIAPSEAGAGGFGPPAFERYRKLERSIAELDRQISAARDALATAEQHLKQHERAAALRTSASSVPITGGTPRLRRTPPGR